MKDIDTIEKIKERIRLSSSRNDIEIQDLIDSAMREMEIKGVSGSPDDPLYLQATVLYCKARYGYDEQSDEFFRAFQQLTDSMALSGEYRKGKEDV